MSRVLLATLAFALLGTSCRMQSQKVGDSRDSHGCLISGGYNWCAKEKSCLRMWELAREKDLHGQSAEDYCAGKPPAPQQSPAPKARE